MYARNDNPERGASRRSSVEFRKSIWLRRSGGAANALLEPAREAALGGNAAPQKSKKIATPRTFKSAPIIRESSARRSTLPWPPARPPVLPLLSFCLPSGTWFQDDT